MRIDEHAKAFLDSSELEELEEMGQEPEQRDTGVRHFPGEAEKCASQDHDSPKEPKLSIS